MNIRNQLFFVVPFFSAKLEATEEVILVDV